MAETTPTPAVAGVPSVTAAVSANKPPLVNSPFSISKNGVSLTFVDATKDRGQNVGDHFITLGSVGDSPESLNKTQDIMTFLGLPVVVGIVSDYYRDLGMKTTESCLNADGSFDQTKFTKLFPSLAGSTESNRQLELKNQELLAQVVGLDIQNPDNAIKMKQLLGQMQDNVAIIRARKDA